MFGLGDEEIEALLSHQIIKIPKIKCASGNLIQKFCSNTHCQQDALCCNEDSCKDCEAKHEKCILGDLKKLAKKVEESRKLNTNYIRNCLKIENEFMSQLIASQRNLIKYFNFLNFDKDIENSVDSIFFKADPKGLKGKNIKALFQRLSQRENIKVEDYFQQFKISGENAIKNLIALRQKCLESIFTIEDQVIDSVILRKDKAGKEKINFLLKQLEFPKKFMLIFRASQDNFSAVKFHQHCDYIPNTLTIIRTQFNRVIAAFTPLRWSSNEENVADPYLSSFLLQLDLKQKMTLIKRQQLSFGICNHPEWGPQFGQNGLDMHISDNCNEVDKSGAFSQSYSRCSKHQKNSQQSSSAFSGASNGYKFKVLEYEVFQVIK